MRAGVGSALAMVLLAGCALLADPGEQRDLPPPTPAPVARSWPGCLEVRSYAELDEAYDGPSGGVPAEFRPVRAVTCDTDRQADANGATVLVAVERSATDVSELVTALALPSQEIVRWGNTACPAIGWVPPWLFLIDAEGRWIHPQLPLTGCHLPRPELDTALQNLEQTTTVLRTLRITESAEAVRAGCAQQWKNMINETLDRSGSSVGYEATTGDPFSGRPVRRCVYDFAGVPGEPGSFLRGGSLSASQQRAVAAGLSRSTPIRTACSQQPSEFAVLRRTDDAGPLVYVELSGCQRVLVSGDRDTVAAAAPDLIEELR